MSDETRFGEEDDAMIQDNRSSREDGAAAAALEEEEAEAAAVGEEIAALQAQLTDASEKHLRLAADFDNYRRRVERDRADALARAQAGLVKRLLDVMDDLERVAHHGDPNVSAQALLEGVQLIERKLRQVLESSGLEQVAAEDGRFDPQTMEAVASVPAESPEEDETVSDVFQKGYRFNGVLVRPARVRVRKHD
jgi:molecular chaperone GrpE